MSDDNRGLMPLTEFSRQSGVTRDKLRARSEKLRKRADYIGIEVSPHFIWGRNEKKMCMMITEAGQKALADEESFQKTMAALIAPYSTWQDQDTFAKNSGISANASYEIERAMVRILGPAQTREYFVRLSRSETLYNPDYASLAKELYEFKTRTGNSWQEVISKWSDLKGLENQGAYGAQTKSSSVLR